MTIQMQNISHRSEYFIFYVLLIKKKETSCLNKTDELQLLTHVLIVASKWNIVNNDNGCLLA